jgi:hypothetical protein
MDVERRSQLARYANASRFRGVPGFAHVGNRIFDPDIVGTETGMKQIVVGGKELEDDTADGDEASMPLVARHVEQELSTVHLSEEPDCLVEIIDDGVDMVHGTTSDWGHIGLLASSIEGVTAQADPRRRAAPTLGALSPDSLRSTSGDRAASACGTASHVLGAPKPNTSHQATRRAIHFGRLWHQRLSRPALSMRVNAITLVAAANGC